MVEIQGVSSVVCGMKRGPILRGGIPGRTTCLASGFDVEDARILIDVTVYIPDGPDLGRTGKMGRKTITEYLIDF